MEEKRICKVEHLDNNDILPNRFQPRKYFDEEEILQLAESIKEHGVINPIIVRKLGDKYELVAGERRYKANILAGNDNIPAIIMDVNDKESSEIAVVENIQRKDLNPVEEAISYKRSLDIGYMTQEQLAQKMGKSQSYIANKIRLLKLSDEVQDALMKKEISERHARSLLKLTSLKKQNELLKRIIDERLTVRKTDEEIEKMNNNINNSIGGIYNMNDNAMENNVVSPTLDLNNNISNNNVISDNQLDNELSIPEIHLNGANVSNTQQNLITPSNQNQQMENNNFIVPPTSPIEEKITPIIPEKTVSDINLDSFNVFDSSLASEQNQSIMNNDFVTPTTTPIEEEQNTIQSKIQLPETNLDTFNTPVLNSTSGINQNQSIINNDFLIPPIAPIEEEITPIIKEKQDPKVGLDSFSFPSLTLQPELNNTQTVENDEFLMPHLNSIEESAPNITDTIQPESEIKTINIPSIESETNPLSLENLNMLNQKNQSMDDNSSVASLYTDNNVINNQNSLNNALNNNFNADIKTEEPLFKTSPIIDTTVNQELKNDVELTSDLDSNINNNNIDSINDVSNFYKPEVKPEPIIVNEYNQQYDPIMPDSSNNQPTIDFKSILSLIRKCSAAIENSGYKIETEEYNLDNLYQVVFKIEKK